MMFAAAFDPVRAVRVGQRSDVTGVIKGID